MLPSKPKPEFVETFGIALVEKMLAGGGPVITTATGGILEAVGDTAGIIPIAVTDGHRRRPSTRRCSTCTTTSGGPSPRRPAQYALQFDRLHVFDRLIEPTLVSC